MPKKNDKSNYICCRCQSSFTDTNAFFKANSGVHACVSKYFVKKGYMPICKKCAIELIHEYYITFKDYKKAFFAVCSAYDMYYCPKLIDDTIKNEEGMFGLYVRKLNMKQYVGKTFADNIAEGLEWFMPGERDAVPLTRSDDDGDDKDDEDEEEIEEEEITAEDMEHWIPGLSKEDYNLLNTHRDLLIKSNPGCTTNQLIFVEDLCYTKMQQMRALKSGDVDTYNKLAKTYRDAFSQSGLQMVEAKKAEVEVLGVTIETIEKYTPAEYYKSKTLFKDFDGIGDYMLNTVYRPLKNLMFGSHDRDKDYHVKSKEELGVGDEDDDE